MSSAIGWRFGALGPSLQVSSIAHFASSLSTNFRLTLCAAEYAALPFVTKTTSTQHCSADDRSLGMRASNRAPFSEAFPPLPDPRAFTAKRGRRPPLLGGLATLSDSIRCDACFTNSPAWLANQSADHRSSRPTFPSHTHGF